MSSALFRVEEHILPCQHIRGYPFATAISQEEILHLSIKQYTPLDNLNPRAGDVTIIGAHANGFPKELYEPLWDELSSRASKAGVRIRGIWIADVAHQGASGVLNERKLGNDPSWFDHPRDLLYMINHFRAQMPRPLVGVGHSMGGNNLVNLSLIHPRLFETLILIDPVIQRFSSAQGNYLPATASAFRRDRWPSRKAAAESFRKSKFYQAWDPRVLDLWIKHGLRDLPTALYPDVQPNSAPPPTTTEPTLASPTPAEPEVTLTTTKHQEVFTFLRPNLAPLMASSGSHKLTTTNPTHNRLTHPDITPTARPESPFYRPEPIITFHNLRHLRPSVLYIFGSLSALSAPELRADKMTTTGIGVGGSGGAAEGRVKEVVLEGVGHLIPMERVRETAEFSVDWLGKEMARWRENEKVTAEGKWETEEDKIARKRGVLSQRVLDAFDSEALAMGVPQRSKKPSKL